MTAVTAQAPAGAPRSRFSQRRLSTLGAVQCADVRQRRDRDAYFRLLDYRLTNLADAGSSAIQNLTYSYDDAKNVSAIADAVTAANSQSFGY